MGGQVVDGAGVGDGAGRALAVRGGDGDGRAGCHGDAGDAARRWEGDRKGWAAQEAGVSGAGGGEAHGPAA